MSTTPGIDHLSNSSRCFRPQWRFLIVGVFCALLFAAVGIASTLIALWNIDGSFAQPLPFAIVFAVFWSGFTLLAIWMILAYFRERLYVGKDGMVQHEVFHSKTVALAEVIQVNWHTRPQGGKVVVLSLSETVTIYLGNFERDDGDELIRLLRATFPVERQVNWSEFDEVFRVSSPPSEQSLRNASLVTLAIHTIVSGAFIYCYFAGLGKQFLAMGILNVFAAVNTLAGIRPIKGSTDFGGARKEGLT